MFAEGTKKSIRKMKADASIKCSYFVNDQLSLGVEGCDTYAASES